MRAVGKGRPIASGRLSLRRTLTHGGRNRDVGVGVGVFGVAEYYVKQNKSSRVIQPFTPWGDDTYQERRFGKPAGGNLEFT
jgi:hypothetical protein